MTAGNVPAIAAHYGETSRGAAIHRRGKGQENKICGVHKEVLFKRELDWTGALSNLFKREVDPLIIHLQ